MVPCCVRCSSADEVSSSFTHKQTVTRKQASHSPVSDPYSRLGGTIHPVLLLSFSHLGADGDQTPTIAPLFWNFSIVPNVRDEDLLLLLLLAEKASLPFDHPVFSLFFFQANRDENRYCISKGIFCLSFLPPLLCFIT